MRRREFLGALAGAAVAWPNAARAQQRPRTYRVAYLATLGDDDAKMVKQRLAELGYVEGSNLVFDFRSADGHQDRLPPLAAELLKSNPDIIIAGFGTAAPKAAQAATSTIPIVFVSAAIRSAPAWSRASTIPAPI